MIRLSSRWSAVLAVAALAACGSDPAGSKPDAGDPPHQQTKVLTRVGPGTLQGHPGDALTLQALLSMSEVGPVVDGAVTWRLVEDPGSTALAGTSSSTNEAGVAEMKVTLGDQGTVTIRADSAGATSKAVWKIDVRPVVKHVRIVEGTDVTNTDASAQHATVAAAVGRQTVLRVRVSAEQGEGERPVPSEPVAFSFQSTISGAAFQGNASGATTSQGDGEANVVLTAGTVAGTYTVVATISGGVYVTFEVAVSSGTGQGGACQSSAQCPTGQVCSSGACVSSGPGGSSCGSNDRPCPIGYSCDAASGLCKPSFGGGCDHCPLGTHCDTTTNQCNADDPECSDAVACPTGFNCQSGLCVPTDGTIDVTGHWYTKHDFDVKAALPGWVRFSSTAIRAIDQTLLGQLNLPGWVNSLIRGVVQQYIPPWVQQVVYILDNILTVFSNLRAEGEMDLVANGGPSILSGEETWTSFVFYLLSQCGTNISGSLTNPPACARLDIYTTELDQADLAVQVLPFAAKVSGTATGGYTLLMDKRQAKMKLAGILKFVLDQVISVTTGYPSLEDKPCQAGQSAADGECGPGSGALAHLVDCEAINQWVQDLGVPIDVTGLCAVAVGQVGQIIAQQLRQVTLEQDVLEFSGQATARPTAGVATYADELGYEDYETRQPANGIWNGKFHVVVSVHDVPGRWRASRNPFLQPQGP